MAKILVVDDSREVVDSVTALLRGEQYEVWSAATAADGLQMLFAFEYDLVILDWQLPDKSGLEVLQLLRKRGGKVRVLMLTGRTEEDDIERGLDSGADDYLTKPFVASELCARVRALLRRSLNLESGLLMAGPIAINVNTLEAFVHRLKVDLNRKEFQLLEFFVRNSNRVFSEDVILSKVWSDDEDASSDALRSTVKRLRKKVDPDSILLKNLRGVGYILKTDDSIP